MVLKTEKHGVRTGNTVKRWDTHYYRKYKSQAYLIRSHLLKESDEEGMDFEDIAQFHDTGAFGEGQSMSDGIEYSLNKHMRWELPRILENKILEETHEEDYAIELVERHRVNTQANCINVCSTSGIHRNGKLVDDEKQVNVLDREHSPSHFQANTVLQNSNPERKRNHKRTDQDESTHNTDEPVTKNENKLRYEVHYPAPTDSYLCHIPERIGIYTKKDFWNVNPYKTQRSRKLAIMNEHIKESLAIMEEPLDESDEESTLFYSDDDNCDDVKTQDYLVTLDEILLHANTASRLVSNRYMSHSDSSLSSNDSSSTKDHVFFVEKEDAQYFDPIKSTEVKLTPTEPQTITSIVMEAVRIVLNDKMVSPQALASTYGKNYIECECFPRKFIITISDRVNKLNTFRKSFLTSNVCIVFIHDVDNEINNAKESVYKVMLNGDMNNTISSVKIETIFDYMETNIDEIIDKSILFIETLPEDSLVCETESKSYRSKVAQTSLERFAKWSSSAYLPRNDFLFDYFIAHVKGVDEAVDMGFKLVDPVDATLEDGTENVASPKGRLCCICFLTLDDATPGTALIACSHWVCDSCWKEYLHTKVTDGALLLVCPEFGCDNIIDAGTVLSIVNVQEILIHAKNCHDNEVQQQTFTKWCPNEKCGRVLKINNIHTKNCQCFCGLKICFDCLDPPHWPASCESVKQYYKKMRDTGDITLEPPELKPMMTVHGKHCPSCHRFVEKNGGCPYMNCVCSVSFCWGCGQVWASRTHGSECYKYGFTDSHGTTAKSLQQRNVLELKKRNKFYKMALIHRVNQHPAKVQGLKKVIKPLSKKLQSYVLKTEKSRLPVTHHFRKCDTTFYNEYKKALRLVTNTVELYSEINHVVENTAVVLSFEQLSRDNIVILKSMSNRLSGLAEAIYELFCEHESFQTCDIFNKLTETRFYAEKTMQSLIRCIKSIQL
ncbi:hypothetical protein ACF0H5_019206 [Mactra antiquata]